MLGMDSFLFSSVLPDGREICVSAVSRDAFEANRAESLGDDTGYFIYEHDFRHPGAGIEILAKAASVDAAIRLVDIFVMAGKSSA